MSEKAIFAIICAAGTALIVVALRWKGDDDSPVGGIVAIIGVVATATILGGC